MRGATISQGQQDTELWRFDELEWNYRRHTRTQSTKGESHQETYKIKILVRNFAKLLKIQKTQHSFAEIRCHKRVETAGSRPILAMFHNRAHPAAHSSCRAS